MTWRNRQWLLSSRPSSRLSAENFAYREQDLEPPHLEPGQVLVRNLAFSCAPTIRNWMNESGRSYRAPIALGEPIIGPACARVVRSQHRRFRPGSLLIGVSRWEDFSVIEPELAFAPVLDVPPGMSPVAALGVYGLNSLTAYFGLLSVGRPASGDTVVVSGAAGAVGSVALQIAKIKGCRAIGIAGGKEKCNWLRKACGADDAIDYLSDDVSAALTRLAPDGVDVFFDNVGGELLQILIERMAVHGRVVVCGQVSAYDSATPAQGPRDMMRVVYQRLCIQGFVLGDFRSQVHAARTELMRWCEQGKIVRNESVRHGFAALPTAFIDLFSGKHRGSLGGAPLVNIA
jgi:NADPH-dependent curcumin reductase CurA